MNLPRGRLIALGLASVLCASAHGAAPKVSHTPLQPKSGETVCISARVTQPIRGRLELQYQVVEPGAYIDLTDPAFKRNWVSLPMNDSGEAGDAIKADAIFTAEVSGKLQMHRRLVRYRVALNGQVIAPPADSATPNFGYFVYDGVPSWRGAINPNSDDPKLRAPLTFDTNVMRSQPVYHLISKKASVENATWYEQTEFGNDAARKKYNYTGTFVADDGKVYDHVHFRARGGEWRHAMGKNMWKLDFNRGDHLDARDNFGRKYKARWEKLNLGACIPQGSYGMRGEHGMFEAVGFKLFNLAGVEAPRTHWVHFRIIDGAEESPADQYQGDFWGLYLATEDIDDAFLKEHELPSGNLYKIEFGEPELHTKSQFATPNKDDVRQFMAAYRRPQDESWWRTNLDLARYFSYRAIVECIHHYDIGAGKNYFYYHNPRNGLWSVLPWDIDLSWGDHMYGTALEPFYRAGVLSQPALQIEYQNRLREIRDLLFNPEQMDTLIEEQAAIISNPNGSISFIDADRAEWDYHPIMASRFVLPRKTRPGQFYESAATHDFRGMLQLMKEYVRTRAAWVDATLLNDPAIPPTPSIAPGPLDFSATQLSFIASLTNGEPVSTVVQWRVAEVTLDSTMKGQHEYEITPLWRTNGTTKVQLPLKFLEAGKSYRVRARVQDEIGRCGHWSQPVEFTVSN